MQIWAHIHDQSVTMLLKKHIGFLCVYYLSAHFHSCCFYVQHHGAIRENTSMPVWIFCFKLFFILLTWWSNIKLFYTTFVLTIQKRSWFEPACSKLSNVRQYVLANLLSILCTCGISIGFTNKLVWLTYDNET